MILLAGEKNVPNAPEKKVGQNLKINKMKTLILKSGRFGFLLVLFIAISCSKNDGVFDQIGKSKHYYTLPNGQELTINPNPIFDYLCNKEDANDEKIRIQRYELGLIIRDLFVDNSYNEMIINNALNKENNTMSLQEFINENKADNVIKENDLEIFAKLQSSLNSIDFTHKSTNPLKKGEIEDYIPALFLINAENADFRMQPFISMGIEVNSELPGLADFDDFIVAWFADENGTFYELLLDEEFVMNTTHPVFTVDNAEYEMSQKPKTKIGYAVDNNFEKNQQTATYSTYEYRINHRYENSGDSEFAITATRIDHNNVIHNVLKLSNGTFSLWRTIADVDRKDISKDLYRWVQFCDEAPIPFSTNFIFFNTYERDWFGSLKKLGMATRNGVTIHLSGNRTYTDDWYAFDPALLNDNPLDVSTVYYSWAKWYSNDKGHLRFWRIQP